MILINLYLPTIIRFILLCSNMFNVLDVCFTINIDTTKYNNVLSSKRMEESVVLHYSLAAIKLLSVLK